MTDEGDDSEPLRLLLDTNVFRDLAQGSLETEKARFLHLARIRPPLFWTALLVHDEILAHVTEHERTKFPLYQEALRWVDQLCGNSGIAEGYPSALRSIVFANPTQRSQAARIDTNRARRRLLKCTSFDQIPPELKSVLDDVAAGVADDLDDWANDRANTFKQLRLEETPRQDRLPSGQYHAHVIRIVTEALAELLIEHHAHMSPDGAEPRSAEEVRHHGREFLHYEAALFLKASLLPRAYDFRKNRNSYYDHLLCSFPASGFMLVTSDKGIRGTLEYAKCPEPRVLPVSEALDKAEQCFGKTG